MTNTGRLETFADGVFAIAITLLVLGIGLPQPNTSLWNALLAEWPALVAYVVSFLTIGVIWINPERVSGTPCFYASRVPVSTLFNCIAAGETLDQFLDDFEGVTKE